MSNLSLLVNDGKRLPYRSITVTESIVLHDILGTHAIKWCHRDRLTITVSHHSLREITSHTTANHIADNNCKGVVSKWQQLSWDIVGCSHRVHCELKAICSTVSQEYDSVDRPVAIKGDAPTNPHPSCSKADYFNILWRIRRLCVCVCVCVWREGKCTLCNTCIYFTYIVLCLLCCMVNDNLPSTVSCTGSDTFLSWVVWGSSFTATHEYLAVSFLSTL